MGGYVCFPGGLMAALLGKPLVLVNADAALLLSNKALLPVADRVAFGFDGLRPRRACAAVVTGNPVRAEIEALRRPAARFAGRSGPLRCWWSAAAWARRCSTRPCRRAGADARRRSARRSCTRPARATATACAPPTPPAGDAADVLPFIDDMARAWPPAT
jgi:UDP-N-acetylglucosamine--N-acetylmuramyl-(pentapeptide) pyrophosphoryl-undecaprenol N-acetylglucosamine transferase